MYLSMSNHTYLKGFRIDPYSVISHTTSKAWINVYPREMQASSSAKLHHLPCGNLNWQWTCSHSFALFFFSEWWFDAFSPLAKCYVTSLQGIHLRMHPSSWGANITCKITLILYIYINYRAWGIKIPWSSLGYNILVHVQPNTWDLNLNLYFLFSVGIYEKYIGYVQLRVKIPAIVCPFYSNCIPLCTIPRHYTPIIWVCLNIWYPLVN